MSFNSAILTYHSQNISGTGTHDNDHVALARDLAALSDAGIRIVPLSLLADALDGHAMHESVDGAVCLSFDDGCDFDVHDIDYPGHGVQRSLLGILRDFKEEHGADAQPLLHATSFVIASEEARALIDARSLFGRGWISDDWWSEAEASGLLAVENHGWDHNHPDLAPEDPDKGGFANIDSLAACRLQVERAAEEIARKSGRRPAFFAYPFGESSAYLRETYFPEQVERHRCRAALGTDRGHVTENTERWNLPRYVCGRDWKSPEELLSVLKG